MFFRTSGVLFSKESFFKNVKGSCGHIVFFYVKDPSMFLMVLFLKELEIISGVLDVSFLKEFGKIVRSPDVLLLKEFEKILGSRGVFYVKQSSGILV